MSVTLETIGVHTREIEPTFDGSPLLGCAIDAPTTDEPFDGYYLLLRGWALGRTGPPEHIEIGRGRESTLRLVPNQTRPDIAAAFPQVAGAERCGFEAAVSLLGMPLAFNLRIAAIFPGERAKVGVVTGVRRPLGLPPAAEGPMPLLVTTLGRSGSMWLGHLLGQHPDVVVYRPFELEPRAVGYWTAVLQSLSEPISYRQVLGSVLGAKHWWLGDPSQPQVDLGSVEDGVSRFLSASAVESTAAFCRFQIQTFYDSTPGAEGSPRWFVEKAALDTAHLCRELFNPTRELVLVRDFRDMISSVISFNRKRGFESFGRELVASDVDFVHEMRERAIALLESWNERRDEAHLVRYEDLIGDPESTLRSIFSYIDVDGSPVRIGEVIRRAHETAGSLQAGHRTSADAVSSIGRWERDLPADLRSACREAFADLLPEFGYAS